MAQTIFELELGATNQLGKRRGDEDIGSPADGADACARVDRDPSHLAARKFDLPYMDSGSDIHADRLRLLDHGTCAADGLRGNFEDREQTVPGGIDLATIEPFQLLPEHQVVTPQKLPPMRVAEPSGDLR